MKGFTFIELILVVALISIVTAMSAVFYTRFLTQNAVLNTVDQLVGQMHKAQIYAMSGRQGSNWGVNYSSSVIILYSGNSYLARNNVFDEKFSVNSNITVSGFSDINFNRLTGVPNVTPTITITGNNNTKSIIINSQGGISR